MSDNFYEKTKTLDACKRVINIAHNELNIVLNLIDNEAYAKYFFSDLENPSWIVPIYNEGIFHRPPDPEEDKPGYFRNPPWYAGEFLIKFAENYEDIIVDLVQTIKTENWRVQEILVDGLLKITPERAANLVQYIDSWLEGPFSRMLPIKLGELSKHLLDHGYISASIELLGYIVKPILPTHATDLSRYRSPLRFRSEHYWVCEYLNNQLPVLLSKDPKNVAFVFEQQLEHAIELVKGEEADLYVGYYWRLDLPNRSIETSDADALDILIDCLRDSINEVCKQSTEDGKVLINNYLHSEHVIFQRLSLFALRRFGKTYQELVDHALLTQNYLQDDEYASEYSVLLKSQFSIASERVQNQVVAWIIEGPDDVEKRVKNHTGWENRDPDEKDRKAVKDLWILRHLEIIRDHLTGDALNILNQLVSDYGKPDISETPHVITTEWGGPESPISKDDLSMMSFEKVLDFFINYEPEDLFMNPRESLAETSGSLVKENPDQYSNFAPYLINSHLRFVYTYHYLSGLGEGIKTDINKLDKNIVDLCEFVVGKKEDPFIQTSGRHEPGLLAAQLEVARLFERVLHSKDPTLERGLLDRIRKILIELAHHQDPEMKDEESSFDAFTRSLNCVRGVAMHALIQYSLYIVRQKKAQLGVESLPGFLEPEIQTVLEEKLDKANDPSPAVHAVFGAYLSNLNYLAPDWLQSHLDEILPIEEENSAYWKAAWDAYIFASNVKTNIFEMLIPHYQRGLRLLSQKTEDEKSFTGSPNERLAQHVMVAYLNDLTGFGHDNQLLDLFYAHAPDKVRANAVFWLSQVLEEDKKHHHIENLWEKCWDLWQKRLAAAETQNPSVNTHEIANYMRWLENCPLGLDEIFDTLLKSVKYLQVGFEMKVLTEYVALQSEAHPLMAVKLLQAAILGAKEPWWSPDQEDEKKILSMAMVSGNPEARQIAIEVINYRGEQGDFRWKELLDLPPGKP